MDLHPLFKQIVELRVAGGNGWRIIPNLFINPMSFVFEMLSDLVPD
jgi:putative component of toxin-antitoxin plasmid stabilization module